MPELLQKIDMDYEAPLSDGSYPVTNMPSMQFSRASVIQPVPYTPQVALEVGDTKGFWDFKEETRYLKSKFAKNKIGEFRGSMGVAAREGSIPLDLAFAETDREMMTQLDKFGSLEDVYFKKEPVQFVLGEGAQVFGSMLSSTEAALKSGSIGALAALGLSALGITVSIPALGGTALGVAAAGGFVGSRYGVWKHSSDVEGGNIYLDLRESGISHKTAGDISQVAGGVIGLIEMFQFEQITSPLRKAGAKLFQDTAGKTLIKEALKNYAKNWVSEVAEEELQFLTETVAKVVAARLENTPELLPSTADITDGMLDTLIKTGSGLAVVQAGTSVAGSVASVSIDNFKEYRQKQLKNKAYTKPVEQEVEAFIEAEEAKAEIEEQKATVEQEKEKGTPVKEDKKKPKKKVSTDRVFQQEQVLDFTEQDRKARLRTLQKEVSQTGRGIQSLIAEIEQRLNEKKPIAQVEKRLQKVIEQRNEALYDLDYIENTPLENLKLGRKTVAVRADQLRAKNLRRVQEKVQAYIFGKKLGIKQAVEGFKSVQNDIISLVYTSDLTDKQKKNFMMTIKNITSDKVLKKQLPKIEDRINRLIEKNQKKAQINLFDTLTKSKVYSKLGQPFKDQIKTVKEAYDKVKVSDKKRIQLEGLVKEVQEVGKSAFDEATLKDISRLDKIPLADLSSEDITLINRFLQNLYALDTQVKTIKVRDKTLKMEKAINDMVKSMQIRPEIIKNNEVVGRKILDTLSNKDWQKIQKEKGRKLPKWMLQTGHETGFSITTFLDGGNENGVFGEVFDSNFILANRKEKAYKQTLSEYFKRLFSNPEIAQTSRFLAAHTLLGKKKEPVFTTLSMPDYGEVKLTPMEKIGIYLQTLHPDNLRSLMGDGIIFKKPSGRYFEGEAKRLTEADIKAVQDSLTPTEKEIADKIVGYYQAIEKPEINGVSTELLGFEIAAVEGTFIPKQTIYQQERMSELFKRGDYQRVYVEGLGIFKPRMPGAKAAVLIGDPIETIYRRMVLVSHYVGFAEPLRTAKEVLSRPELKREMETRGLHNYYKYLEDHIERIEGVIRTSSDLDKAAQKMLSRFTPSTLGFRLTTPFKAAASFLLGMNEIDIMKYGDDYISSYRPKPSKILVQEMTELPEFWDRFLGHMTQSISDVMESESARKLFTGEKSLQDLYISWISSADLSAVSSIYRYAKKEIANENPSFDTNTIKQEALKRAWDIIRKTQPTADIVNQTGFQKRRADTFLDRAMNLFTSQTQKNAAMFLNSMHGLTSAPYSASARVKFFKTAMLTRIAMPLIISSISTAFRAATDRDKEVEDLWKDFVISFFTTSLFGDVFLLGKMAQAMAFFANYNMFTGVDPITGALYDIFRGAIAGYKIIHQSIFAETLGWTKKERVDYLKQTEILFDGFLSFLRFFHAAPIKTVKEQLEDVLETFGRRENISYTNFI